MQPSEDAVNPLEEGHFDYCLPLRKLVETGKVCTPDGEVIQSHAASTVNNLVTLRNLIKEEKSSRTLEIGLAHGASALAILATLKEIHADSEFKHVAIDPFQTTQWKSIALTQIKDTGLLDYFEFFEDESCFALPDFCRQQREFDMIYIDGSHLFEDVFVDFYYCARLLTTGGVLLFDDCRDKHVRKVISFVERNYNGILKRESFFNHGLQTIKRNFANSLGITQLVGFRKTAQPPREWNSEFTSF